MRKSVPALVVSTLALVLAPLVAVASGGSSVPQRETRPAVEEATPRPPEEIAVEHYNYGLKNRDKAWKLEKQAASASSASERQKLLKKAGKQYDKAIGEYEAAIRNKPDFHQALSSLGYALRKTGRYEEALGAYDRALSLEPSYPEAIEYRAEAYLGLDRLEDAKEAYVQLFGTDRARADELLVAMKSWLDRRESDPGDLGGETIAEFADWVREREEVAAQTASLSQLQEREW